MSTTVVPSRVCGAVCFLASTGTCTQCWAACGCNVLRRHITDRPTPAMRREAACGVVLLVILMFFTVNYVFLVSDRLCSIQRVPDLHLSLLLLPSERQFLHPALSVLSSHNWDPPNAQFLFSLLLLAAFSYGTIVLGIKYNESFANSQSTDEASDDVAATKVVALAASPIAPLGALPFVSATDSCPVCFMALNDVPQLRVTPCDHVFCSQCLESVVHSSKTASALKCPLCRSNLIENQQDDAADDDSSPRPPEVSTAMPGQVVPRPLVPALQEVAIDVVTLEV